MNGFRATFTVFLLFLASMPVTASSCSVLRDGLDEVRVRLRRAAEASNLDEGRHQARRAQLALIESAESANACACPGIVDELESAAYMAGRAYTAFGATDFASSIKHALMAFDAGTQALEACPALQ